MVTEQCVRCSTPLRNPSNFVDPLCPKCVKAAKKAARKSSGQLAGLALLVALSIPVGIAWHLISGGHTTPAPYSQNCATYADEQAGKAASPAWFEAERACEANRHFMLYGN